MQISNGETGRESSAPASGIALLHAAQHTRDDPCPGTCADASKSFLHANLGQQQFHLAENGDPPQRIAGSTIGHWTGSVVLSLGTLRERIAAARKALAEKQLLSILADDGDAGCVNCCRVSFRLWYTQLQQRFGSRKSPHIRIEGNSVITILNQVWDTVIDPNSNIIYMWINGHVQMYQCRGQHRLQYQFVHILQHSRFPRGCAVPISGQLQCAIFHADGYAMMTMPTANIPGHVSEMKNI
jgi:hypothetical protein